jgi:hypothetical protein
MLNRLTIFLIISFALCISSEAQNSTQSPYSLTGIGELKFNGFNEHKGLGGVSRSLVDPYSFSPLNPASYANTSTTGFVAGMSTRIGSLNTATESSEVGYGNFDNFALVFPFGTEKPMAISLGAYQLSQVGYDVRNRFNADTPSYYNLFKGTGGINRVYFGYAITPLKNLSIGGNVNFNYGNIQTLAAKVYPNTDDYFSFSDETLYSYRGIDFDLGVQYTVHQKDSSGRIKFGHTFAGTFHTKSSLVGDGYRYSETFFGRAFDQGNLLPIDTLIFQPSLKDTLNTPIGFAAGYSWKFSDKLTVSLEGEWNKWSDLTAKINGLQYFDNVKYAVGVSYIPNPTYTKDVGYLAKIRYTAGYRTEKLYYNFGGVELNEVGISFGLGLPIVNSYRDIETGTKKLIISRINIFGEYMTRGTTDNGLIREDYFNIGIGLNFNDKWFQKNKYR